MVLIRAQKGPNNLYIIEVVHFLSLLFTIKYSGV